MRFYIRDIFTFASQNIGSYLRLQFDKHTITMLSTYWVIYSKYTLDMGQDLSVNVCRKIQLGKNDVTGIIRGSGARAVSLYG